MDLESNGTNINLEILSKAIATRYKVKEVPAVLEGRELGSSKLAKLDLKPLAMYYSHFMKNQ